MTKKQLIEKLIAYGEEQEILIRKWDGDLSSAYPNHEYKKINYITHVGEKIIIGI